MAWPIDDLTTDALDGGTDKLRLARVEIYLAVLKLKELLAWGGGETEVSMPYDLAFFIAGNVSTDGIIVGGYGATRAVTISEDFPGSVAVAKVAPTNNIVYSIEKDDIQVGTLEFYATQTTGAFYTTAGSFSLDVLDVLTIVNPATADATIADIAITIVGCADNTSC